MQPLMTQDQAGKKLLQATKGFTLVELMVAVGLFSLVVAGSVGVYIMCQKIWRATTLNMDTSRMASLAIQRMVYGVGTNSGLRSAASVALDTNVGGHPYVIANDYWETGVPPPVPADPVHYVHVNCAAGGYHSTHDGSWRLTFSNAFEGVVCIDYNIKQRNILFCPDTNQTSVAFGKRILIGNYVSSATVTTNAGSLEINLTVWKKDGMFVASNQASAFIRMRH